LVIETTGGTVASPWMSTCLIDSMSGSDRSLFRSLTPLAVLETLPKRMLAFLFRFHDLCELYAEEVGTPFEELLEKGAARKSPLLRAPSRRSRYRGGGEEDARAGAHCGRR
jgi:hypothetical protein